MAAADSAARADSAGDLLIDDVHDVVTAVDRAAARWPDRPAWTFPDEVVLTFTDVATRSVRMAAALDARGVIAGDRVGVMLANRAEFPLVWLALARLGAAIVPLNPRYRTADLEHVLRSARCRAVVTTPADGAALTGLPTDLAAQTPIWPTSDLVSNEGPASPILPSDPLRCLNVQFTSGTTGRPKGCLLSHEYWIVLGRSLITEFPRLTKDDVMLTAQPCFYLDPQWNIITALLAGAHLIVLDGFHPSSFWDEVRRHRVTYFYCLASMPSLLLTTAPASSDHDHQVRAVQCSAIPRSRHAELEQRWGTAWYEAFGMTETGADLRVNDGDHDELVATGCVGGPAAHREVRIVGDDGLLRAAGERGELQLRGPGMMLGYFENERATSAAFAGEWFRTGDLAHTDQAGRVYLDGRIKDMIRRSGENIAAGEVEEVLTAHPDVHLAAVISVPDELRGEEVKAVVMLSTSGSPSHAEATVLTAYCADRLAAFKVPRYWEFRSALPLTASQRVEKAALGPATGVVHDTRPGRS